MFNLSATDYAEEPLDKIATNLYIEGEVAKQQEREAKWQAKQT